jgi:predicted transcriptional regulator
MNKLPRNAVRHTLAFFIVAMSMATFTGRNVRGSSGYLTEDDILSQKTRSDIYQIIDENEGMHFRKICREIDKKMGVVQYHISVLEKNGLIRSVKDGRYKCFFSTRKGKSDATEYRPDLALSNDDKKLRESVVTAIKRKTPKKIIDEIIEKDKISHQELAKICEVTPQAITFHCQRLEKTGIIASIKVGRQKYYTLGEGIRPLLEFIDLE